MQNCKKPGICDILRKSWNISKKKLPKLTVKSFLFLLVLGARVLVIKFVEFRGTF